MRNVTERTGDSFDHRPGAAGALLLLVNWYALIGWFILRSDQSLVQNFSRAPVVILAACAALAAVPILWYALTVFREGGRSTWRRWSIAFGGVIFLEIVLVAFYYLV